MGIGVAWPLLPAALAISDGALHTNCPPGEPSLAGPLRSNHYCRVDPFCVGPRVCLEKPIFHPNLAGKKRESTRRNCVPSRPSFARRLGRISPFAILGMRDR
jgi:hypothetical protein